MLAALMAFPLSGVSPLPIRLTVDELERRHKEFAGQTVQVEGVLNTCGPLSCGLLGRADNKPVRTWLSFGTAAEFDRGVATLVGHDLVVEGVVLDDCWSDARDSQGRPMIPCTDRASQFQPLKLIRDLGKQQAN